MPETRSLEVRKAVAKPQQAGHLLQNKQKPVSSQPKALREASLKVTRGTVGIPTRRLQVW